jgi:hypothetical protein
MAFRIAPPLAAVTAAAGLCALAAAQPVQTQYPRVYGINYNPYIESTNSLLHQVGGWNNPATNNTLYITDMATCSHDIVRYRMNTQVMLDEFPQKNDGYRYDDATYLDCLATWSGWHSPDGVDYKQITRNFDLARRVDLGEIDEVFVQGAPYFGYWESTMAGYGGYWCNSSPQQRIPASRIFIMMGFNYERGIGEMMEDYGHRSESILRVVYGSWQVADTHAWNRFTLHDKVMPGKAACGNVHFAPNSQSDYDWGNTTYVWSTHNDWLNNYPNLTGAREWVNSADWGFGDIRLHHLWWFARFPHVEGSLVDYGGMVRLNNWWEYTQNFNAHAPSRGDFVPGGPAPAAAPFEGTVTAVTATNGDNWRPQINAAGQVLWTGWTGTNMEIYVSAADGSGRVAVSGSPRLDELPRMNDAGQVVWQQFDGRDYEIWTGQADGSNRRRITNDNVQSWHPDISATGRIVWEQYSHTSQRYEIMSSNIDGSDLLQISQLGTNGSRPRDSMWPRINASNRVVWFAYNGSAWQIYSANADGTDHRNISNNSAENEFPAINDNNQVVWHAWHTDTNADVYLGSATGGSPVRLSNNGVLDLWPQLNNHGDVTWMQRNSRWQVLYRPFGGTTQTITANTAHNQHPVLDDNGRIAWQGFDGNDWEIYLYSDGVTYQLSDNDYDDRAPGIRTGGEVVWHGESMPGTTGNLTQIYAASFETDPPFAVGDLNCDGAIDTADIDAFVMALVNPGGYATTYPECDLMLADTNGDGSVDTADIDGFVALIIGG